jgi:hypothetical protein
VLPAFLILELSNRLKPQAWESASHAQGLKARIRYATQTRSLRRIEAFDGWELHPFAD